MKPLEALAVIERALRSMTLSADDHDKLRQAVQLIFNELKLSEAPKTTEG